MIRTIAALLALAAVSPLAEAQDCIVRTALGAGNDEASGIAIQANGKIVMAGASHNGAIAAFSPSGLSYDAPAHLLYQAILREIVSGAHDRLGDALLAAQSAYAGSGVYPELLSIFHLLGDPALSLR